MLMVLLKRRQGEKQIMKCELTAEEYKDTVRALDSKYFNTFIGDKSAYISFKDSGDIVLERVYAVEEVSEER